MDARTRRTLAVPLPFSGPRFTGGTGASVDLGRGKARGGPEKRKRNTRTSRSDDRHASRSDDRHERYGRTGADDQRESAANGKEGGRNWHAAETGSGDRTECRRRKNTHF